MTGYVAFPSQKKYIKKVKSLDKPYEVKALGISLIVLPKVYAPGDDSLLMAKKMKIRKSDHVLDLCSGSGIVAIVAAKIARKVVASDISPNAVKTVKINAKKLGLKNIEVVQSDLFQNIKERFDVITINPPYSDRKAKDRVERMFWDLGNRTTKRFFKEAKSFLKPGGRIYFGWANFADLDIKLPNKLAKQFGFSIKKIAEVKPKGENYKNLLFEIRPRKIKG
jgi:release factor glutamine methyltransferase